MLGMEHRIFIPPTCLISVFDTTTLGNDIAAVIIDAEVIVIMP